MNFKIIILFLCLFISTTMNAQSTLYTHEDSLRGSITPQRAWWDLTHYFLDLEVDPVAKYIHGSNVISFNVVDRPKDLQVDLQYPLTIDSVKESHGNPLPFRKESTNVWMIEIPANRKVPSAMSVVVYYSGKPRQAIRAPWDGGFSWSKDKEGMDFIATSCQGLGSSAWWPCKDHMYDEPDSMRIAVTVPKPLTDVSNGRLVKVEDLGNKRKFTWNVSNPINNYGVNVNIANYTDYNETYNGLKGELDLSYYVLPEHLEQAKLQFVQVKKMLAAFEYWFGPYPFYEDGYKLVEVPYLGMEHQSSITYGNQFHNGYLGRDLSGTGWGLEWDFIIIHESGHEWFANNITYKDIADMWIHEGFTCYSECLYTEYYFGKEAGAEYVIGLRKNIDNDKPIIGNYDVNNAGSGDMYNKAANMLHMIRQMVNDDDKWRNMLVSMNKDFYHSVVTTEQIENYMIEKTGINLDPLFDMYLRTTEIPTLEISWSGKKLNYRWNVSMPDFVMPVNLKIGNEWHVLNAKTSIQTFKTKLKKGERTVQLDKNYYVKLKNKV